MSLSTAFSRVSRMYRPSVRRWIRQNLNFLSFFAVGLFTGFYFAPSHPNSKSVSIAAIITYLTLAALRRWAKGDD